MAHEPRLGFPRAPSQPSRRMRTSTWTPPHERLNIEYLETESKATDKDRLDTKIGPPANPDTWGKEELQLGQE